MNCKTFSLLEIWDFYEWWVYCYHARTARATFEWDVAPIPHFEGKPQSSLIVTDSIVLFKDSKVKEEASKFLDFFYSDPWRLEFDKLIGFLRSLNL